MNKVSLKLDKLNYQAEEAFKTLRTNIQFCGSDTKVIAITSCTPDEGKSTVSMRLAISLAESGKKTLLLDTDMRKSVTLGSLHREGQEIFGLSHFLSGQKTLNDVIYETDLEGLFLITSGSFPPNPAELLSSKRFSDMITALRKVFDYIIVDTPPLGSVIDGAVVAEQSDGAALVVESGVISRRFCMDVIDQIRRSNKPLLGVILNKVDMKKGSRYYGRYYGKYYGKYYGEYGNYGQNSSSGDK